MFRLRHGGGRNVSIATAARLHALTDRLKELLVMAPCPERKQPRTLWAYFVRGFVEAHKRRPISFYLLLLIPVVLLLGVHIAEYREMPRRFVAILTLMLVFFWLITARALNDLFFLCRKHIRERRAVYHDTIGDPDFAKRLGEKVRHNQPKQHL